MVRLRNIIILTLAILLSVALLSKALAADISAQSGYIRSDYGANWTDIVNGTTYTYPGFETGVHPQGTWNNPFTDGLDAYTYNDPQDYTEPHTQVIKDQNGKQIIGVVAGPHGSYLTTSHKCRECHSVHEAGGTYKLTRSNTRYEACSWCHSFGAGSGYNIQTDTDEDFTQEFNVGHTMGYGIAEGKWRAPADTYPAYKPNYWMGGFSCFDCHSPHANPQRILGFSNDGQKAYPLYNPGHDNLTSSLSPGKEAKYPPGSWLLLKNPDRELDPETDGEVLDTDINTTFQILWDGEMQEVPVNKLKTDWDVPNGQSEGISGLGSDGFNINEFCADCHDGNAGPSDKKVAMFSEEKAAQGEASFEAYQFGSSHDSNQHLMGVQYKFDPEDGENNGPSCRSCHRGSSDCAICHNTSAGTSGIKWPRDAYTEDTETAIEGPPVDWGGPGFKTLYIADDKTYKAPNKKETNVEFSEGWRMSSEIDVSAACSNDGFCFPHKTISWKMLKDNLFGVDFDGVTPVGPGGTRNLPNGDGSEPGAFMAQCLPGGDQSGSGDQLGSGGLLGEDDQSGIDSQAITDAIDASGVLEPAHDLDSVCLDCHNPEVWNPAYKGELILKGLP